MKIPGSAHVERATPKLFSAFPGYKSVPPGWFKICLGREHPKAHRKSGIEPATPGLHDIGLSPTPRRLPRGFSIFIKYI